MREKFRGLWYQSRKMMLIVAFGILLYEYLENFTAVNDAIKSFFSLLTPVFISIAIAFLVNMPMRFIERKILFKIKKPAIKRVISMILAYLFVVTIIIGVSIFIAPKVAESVVSLASNMESYISQFTNWGNELWDKINFNADIEAKISDFAMNIVQKLDYTITFFAQNVAKYTITVVIGLFEFMIAIILSIYWLFRKEKFIFQSKKVVTALFRRKITESILAISSRTNDALNRYFYGMILECTILGLLCFLFMKIFNFPYALLISVMVGITQMIPYIGPWASAAFGALIIMVTDPSRALWFIVLVVAVQQLEANIFYPKVVGNAVGLSGFWVMIAVLLGGGLFGIVGVILCVPAMAVLYTCVSEWVNRQVEEKRYREGMRNSPPTDEEIRKLADEGRK